MGYDMQEGTVVRWLKPEGSDVKMGEPIAEIETDKAVVEFESYATGVLTKIVVSEGSTVPVGQVIAVVGEVPGEVGVAGEGTGKNNSSVGSHRFWQLPSDELLFAGGCLTVIWNQGNSGILQGLNACGKSQLGRDVECIDQPL